MVSPCHIGTLVFQLSDGQSLQPKRVLNVKAPIGSFNGEKALINLLVKISQNFVAISYGKWCNKQQCDKHLCKLILNHMFGWDVHSHL